MSKDDLNCSASALQQKTSFSLVLYYPGGSMIAGRPTNQEDDKSFIFEPSVGQAPISSPVQLELSANGPVRLQLRRCTNGINGPELPITLLGTNAFFCREHWHYFISATPNFSFTIDRKFGGSFVVECAIEENFSEICQAFMFFQSGIGTRALTAQPERGSRPAEVAHPQENEQLEQLLRQMQEVENKLERVLLNDVSFRATRIWTRFGSMLRLFGYEFPKALLRGKAGLREIRDYLYLRFHGQFVPTWYRLQNPDIEQLPPLWHFVRYGWREGRNPSPHFSLEAYCYLRPDVISADCNPYIHYLRYGQYEGRIANDEIRHGATDAELVKLMPPENVTAPIRDFLLTQPKSL